MSGFTVPARPRAPRHRTRAAAIAVAVAGIVPITTVHRADATVLPQPPTAGPAGSERYGLSNPGEAAATPFFVAPGVDVESGNLVVSAADLAVKGRGRVLDWTRTYNSAAAAAGGAISPGWTHSYAMSLNVDPGSGAATVHQENGSTVTFQPAGGGTYTAAPWVSARLAQNGDGSYTYRLADQRADNFSSSGQLLSEADRFGTVTALQYDAGGNLQTITDPASRTLSVALDAQGRIGSVTDPLTHSAAYTYWPSGDLHTVTDAAGHQTAYGYDGNHQLTSLQDATGATWGFGYSGGRVTTITDPRGYLTTLTYGSGSTTVRDARGNQVVETYADNQITSLTRGYGSPYAATWRYGYDSGTRQNVVVDADGKAWQRSYDATGNLLTSTDPLIHTVTNTYDSANELLSSTDQDGVTTSLNWLNGALTYVSRPLVDATGVVLDHAVTSYQYGDPAHPGAVTMVTDPENNSWKLAWDAAGNLVQVVDPTQATSTAGYNADGWMTTSVSPRGHVVGADPNAFTTHYGYTPFGDLQSVTDPMNAGVVYGYDNDRRLASVADTDGHATVTSYDPSGNAVRLADVQNNTLASARYDEANNLVERHDGVGNVTTHSYDPLNRLVQSVDGLARITNYTDDPNGNLEYLDDATGLRTTSTYDDAGELTGVSFSDGTPPVSYGYYPDGTRRTMSDRTGTSTWNYDTLHRLSSFTRANVGAASWTVSYTSDRNGRVKSIAYPPNQLATVNGGPVSTATGTVSRVYDGDGHLVSVSDWAQPTAHTTTFGYDPDGDLTSIAYANGVTATRTYDNADRVSGITAVDPQGVTLFSNPAITRDAAELVTTTNTLGLPAGSTAAYSYDAHGDLVAATPPPLSGVAARAWSYDNAGEMTGTTVGAQQTAYQYDAADQLRSATDVITGAVLRTYSFDRDGRRASSTNPSGTSAQYGYDELGHLARYTGPEMSAANQNAGSSVTVGYNVDADGVRQAKNLVATTLTYAYDMSGSSPRLISDATSAYIDGPDGMPIEQYTGTQATYYVQDETGSTRLVTDNSARPLGTYSYNPYGMQVGAPGPAANPLLYRGMFDDVDSGLYGLGARSYDPATAQYLQPAQSAPSLGGTPYAFAGNDPVNVGVPVGSALWGVDGPNPVHDGVMWHNPTAPGLPFAAGMPR